MPTHQLVAAPSRKPRDDEIDVYGVTHVGKVRRTNEDHFLVCSLRKHLQVHLTSLPDRTLVPPDSERLAFLAMVADGVGGSAGGEEASRRAVAAITQYVTEAIHCYYTADPNDEPAFPRALEDAARKVHADIQEGRERDPLAGHKATTLTLWIGVWPQAYLLQVGDSRCYLLRDGQLIQLSRDQTLAHVLSSSLGGPESAPVVTAMQQEWNNVGLLCSDGLTKHVPDERIRERLLAMTSARQACEALLKDALDAGGTDNITVIVGRTVRKADR